MIETMFKSIKVNKVKFRLIKKREKIVKTCKKGHRKYPSINFNYKK